MVSRFNVRLAIKIAFRTITALQAKYFCAMTSSDHVLDTCGLFCPEPVMLLHNKMRDIASGDLLKVIATDPSTQRDIPKFCTFLGHELIEQTVDETCYCYVIRKA